METAVVFRLGSSFGGLQVFLCWFHSDPKRFERALKGQPSGFRSRPWGSEWLAGGNRFQGPVSQSIWGLTQTPDE